MNYERAVMTAKEQIKLARAQKDIEYMKADIDEIKSDIQDIKKLLQQDRDSHTEFVTKRFVRWLVGTALTTIAILAALVKDWRM